jgi:anaerobic magnesium-protoporphyrin IX monomethyl ester cyclase
MSLDQTVVLLNPPARELHIRDLYCSITSKANYYWPPIDLVVQSGFVADRFKTVVVDAIAENLSAEQTWSRIRAAAPRGVLSLVGSSSLDEDLRFLSAIKREMNCSIAVSGDVCVDRQPWLLEEYPEVDALVTDFTLPGFVSFLEGTISEPLPGLTYRRNGRFVPSAPQSAAEFDIPVPRHELFPLNRYRLPFARHFPFASVLTNYACPFTCSYCIQNRNVLGYKSRSLRSIEEELRHLKSLGIRELYFRDPLFESRVQHALNVCALLKQYGFSWSCNSRVNTLTEKLASVMRDSGCHCVAFGLETADEEILKRYEKPITLEQSRNAIRTCKKLGLQTVGYFILGLPGENVETIEKTIRFSVESGIDFASFSVPTPDYGTKLREEAVRSGAIESEYRRFNRSRVEKTLSEILSEEVLQRALRKAVRTFYLRPGHFMRILGGIRSWRQALEVLRGAWSIVNNYFFTDEKATIYSIRGKYAIKNS